MIRHVKFTTFWRWNFISRRVMNCWNFFPRTVGPIIVCIQGGEWIPRIPTQGHQGVWTGRGVEAKVGSATIVLNGDLLEWYWMVIVKAARVIKALILGMLGWKRPLMLAHLFSQRSRELLVAPPIGLLQLLFLVFLWSPFKPTFKNPWYAVKFRF